MLDVSMQIDNMMQGGGFGMPFEWSGTMIAIMLVVIAALYVYLSFAFMTIGRKTKDSTPELAWIPFIGPLIIAFRASEMHWWPWLLLIGFFIPLLNFIAMPVFFGYTVAWMWKTFKVVDCPGWWSLTPVLAFVVQMILMPAGFISGVNALATTGFFITNLIHLIYLVFIGIAAWGNA